MPFILRILSYRNQPLTSPLSKRFDTSGGFIGRTPDNDLVLQDPGKSISRKHAKIECRDGNYYLTDLGSNPSLINELALGSGKEARLSQGDKITIGDYLIEAVFETDAGTAPAATPSAQAALHLQPASPPLFQPPPVDIRPTDTLTTAHILGGPDGLGQSGMHDHTDPLGLDLFGGAKPDPSSPAFRGAESDHVSPELQAFPVSASAIPDDYDPLADYRPASSSASVAPVARSDSDDEMLQALLRGLGLPGLQTGRPAPEVAELVGTMLREAVGGAMVVLVARAMTKRESRIDMTMIASQANNPLKFFPDAQSALKQMLTNALPGYMPPVKSIGVAFDDIKSHELAVIAGMRAALSGVLQRFSPAEIEKQFKGSGVMDSMLAVNRKAKMWDRLVELYGEIERDAGDDFQRLFGENFSTAYEEQVERMRGGQERSGKK